MFFLFLFLFYTKHLAKEEIELTEGAEKTICPQIVFVSFFVFIIGKPLFYFQRMSSVRF